MKKTIILFVILFGYFFVNLSLANACSCIQPLSPKESLKNSTAVFTAKVIKINPSKWIVWKFSGPDSNKVQLEVISSYKGLVSKNTIVNTAISSAACWFNFEENNKYIIYASWEQDKLNVSLCSRTKLLSEDSEDIAELGEWNIVESFSPDTNEEKEKTYTYIFLLIWLLLVIFLYKRYRNKK